MAEVGRAELTIIPSFQGGQRSLERQLGVRGSGTGSMGATGRTAGAAFAGGFRSMVAPVGAILGSAVAIDFAKGAIEEASNLGESINALNVVFGESSASIQQIGKDAAANLGLSNVDFNSLAVQFGGFVKTIASESGDITGTLDDLTLRAADFASVMNLEVADAARLFQSGLAGESEPLRRYAIDLSAAAVDAYAYANGIAEVGERLTESEKVQARFGLLMQETEQTAGDFANTSGSLANQQRILAAEWDNVRATLGEALLPVMQDVTSWLLDEGLPGLSQFVDDLDDPTTTIGGIVESLGDLWTAAQPTLEDAFETGGSVAEMFFGGLAVAFETYETGGTGQVISDWIDGTTALGADLSAWGEAGDSAGQQFVHAIDLVMKSFAEGTALEDFAQGVGDMTSAGITSALDNAVLWLDSQGIESGRADKIKSERARENATWRSVFTLDNVAPVTANASSSWGAPVVNIGVVNATDTDDIIRKSEKSARTSAWSGGRPINRGMR